MPDLSQYTDAELEAMAGGTSPDLSAYTDQELEAIVGQETPPANALVEYAKPTEQKQREALAGADAILAAEYPNAGITPAAPQAGDITTTGQALAKVGTKATMDVAPTALRVGVPLTATLLSGGATLPVAAGLWVRAPCLARKPPVPLKAVLGRLRWKVYRPP